MQRALAAAVCWAVWGLAPAMAGQAAAAPRSLDAPASSTSEASDFVRWVTRTADNEGLPFAIVDKKAARIHVFDRRGRLVESSAALLGEAIGDDSAPDVGEHAQLGQVPFDERTTPAGRFISKPGQNLNGEPVVWVDYASAFAIHRLRPGPAHGARKVRLASLAAADRRVSLGCVIVPEAFYKRVIQATLGHSRAVVYVLPETRPLQETFGGL